MIQRIQKMFTSMPIGNAICDTKNVKNKKENTYSIRIIEEENEALRNRIAELEKGELYSTEEQVVGKWRDGKPIYKKTFIGDYINGAAFMGNVDSIIKHYGYTKRGSNKYGIPYSTRFNGKTSFIAPYIDSSNYLHVNVVVDDIASTLYMEITFEYTKTTD